MHCDVICDVMYYDIIQYVTVHTGLDTNFSHNLPLWKVDMKIYFP